MKVEANATALVLGDLEELIFQAAAVCDCGLQAGIDGLEFGGALLDALL